MKDFLTASKLLVEILPLQELALGADHPDFLTMQHNFADWVGQSGNAHAARDLLEIVLKTRTRVLDKDHPEVIKTRAHLAILTGKAGDAERERDLLSELLSDLRQLRETNRFNIENEFSVQTLLALKTGALGDPCGARDLFAGLLLEQEPVLGDDHPDVRATRRYISDWTKKCDDALAISRERSNSQRAHGGKNAP